MVHVLLRRSVLGLRPGEDLWVFEWPPMRSATTALAHQAGTSWPSPSRSATWPKRQGSGLTGYLNSYTHGGTHARARDQWLAPGT